MNDNLMAQLAAIATTANRLMILRSKMTPRLRSLISHCDLVLTDQVLEIYPCNRIVSGLLYRRCKSIATLADRWLGVRVVIKTPWAGNFYLPLE